MSDMTRGRNGVDLYDDVYMACRKVEDPFGAKRVSEELPIGYESTRRKLNELVEEGCLAKKTIGNTGVYWIACFS